jgi:hypothetical protein
VAVFNANRRLDSRGTSDLPKKGFDEPSFGEGDLMKLKFGVVLAFGVAALSWVAYAQSPVRDGQWDVTMQMEMANMPTKMPPMKTTQCITKEQAADPSKSLPSGSADSKNDCKVSDYKVEGSRVSWKVACSRPQKMAGSGEMTFDSDTYDGVLKMSMEFGEMTMKLAGKRIGECTN